MSYADLLQAAQDALFATLKTIEGTVPEAPGLQVLQHVPENSEPPMVIVGTLTSESADEHGDQVELVTAEVQYVWRGAGRAPLLAMMHAGRLALDNQALASPVAAFERPRFLRAEAGDAIADGITYVGLQLFEFTAEPA